MTKNLPLPTIKRFAIFLAICLILVTNGALPFLSLPVLDQGFWAIGFAESISRGNIFNILAHDIGYPLPAAIAFGLPAVLPMSWLIRLGLNGADAYSIIFAIWLLIAFYSCIKLAQNNNLSIYKSIFLALAWLTMPIVWVHNSYSMLQLGIALLPFYYLNFFNLIHSKNIQQIYYSFPLLMLSTFVAIFMDGYSFMFYACGSTLIFLLFTINFKRYNYLYFQKLISYIVSLILPVLAYKTFSFGTNFDNVNLDFLRGWAVDLRFIFQPTFGVHWIADILNLSQVRSTKLYFGDFSVYTSTFYAPLLIVGVIIFFQNKNKSWLHYSFILIFILSFYMALGPTLKINSRKVITNQESTPLMMPDQGVVATGNAIISGNIPGFKTMRASYRWSALAIFSLWFLLLISYNNSKKQDRWLSLGIFLIIILNLPNIPNYLNKKIDIRNDFLKISDSLVTELKNSTSPLDKVLITPASNDFYINYIIPKADLISYNIGGDKNLISAINNWPEGIYSASINLNEKNIVPQMKIIAGGYVDTLIIPYSNRLRPNNCGQFPIIEKNCNLLNPKALDFYNSIKNLNYLNIIISDSFYSVKLKNEFKGENNYNKLKTLLLQDNIFPVFFNIKYNFNDFSLNSGWYSPEENFVWSSTIASLELLLPDNCLNNKCLLKLSFPFINNSSKNLIFTLNGKSLTPTTSQKKQYDQVNFDFIIPADSTSRLQKIALETPGAAPPNFSANDQQDHRILGAALAKIELLQN